MDNQTVLTKVAELVKDAYNHGHYQCCETDYCDISLDDEDLKEDMAELEKMLAAYLKDNAGIE